MTRDPIYKSRAAARDGVMSEDAFAKLTLDSYQKRGRQQPIINVLLSDGRVTQFKDRAMVIPDSDTTRADDEVVALLMLRGSDGLFVPAVKPDGKPVIVAVPVVAVGVLPNPDRFLSFKDIMKLTGASLSSVKRQVHDGRLPPPVKIGKRKVGFRQADVDAALAKLRGVGNAP